MTIGLITFGLLILASLAFMELEDRREKKRQEHEVQMAEEELFWAGLDDNTREAINDDIKAQTL